MANGGGQCTSRRRGARPTPEQPLGRGPNAALKRWRGFAGVWVRAQGWVRVSLFLHTHSTLTLRSLLTTPCPWSLPLSLRGFTMRPWTPTAHSYPPPSRRAPCWRSRSRAVLAVPVPVPISAVLAVQISVQTFLLCGKMGSKASPVRRRIRRCSRLRPGLATLTTA